MPGGVGIQAANYMANVAPQDGTVAARHHAEHVDPSGARRRRRRVRHPQVLLDRQHHRHAERRSTPGTPPASSTIQDVMARELVVGAPGTATDSVYYPKALNELAGTKFKIVTGYPGGNEVNLAMERGEVGGRGSIPGRRGRRPSRTGCARRRSSCWCRSRSSAIRSWPTCRP